MGLASKIISRNNKNHAVSSMCFLYNKKVTAETKTTLPDG